MIAGLEDELFALRQRVDALEQAISPVNPWLLSNEATTQRDRILAMTEDLFKGQVQVVEASDPEIHGDTHIIFRVVAHGTLDELAGKHDEWHRQVTQVAGSFPGAFRLAIDAH